MFLLFIKVKSGLHVFSILAQVTKGVTMLKILED